MKKYIGFILVMMMLIGLSSCTKQQPIEIKGETRILSQEESPIIGTFESGQPEILLSDEALDSIISWAFSTDDNIVSLYDAYIDDIDEGDASIYLVIAGIDQNENCMTLGLTLDKDLEDFNYYLAAVGGRKWTCKIKKQACHACEPTRNWAQIVNGCECTKPVENPPEEACNFETSGGGNWVSIAGLIVSIINFFINTS